MAPVCPEVFRAPSLPMSVLLEWQDRAWDGTSSQGSQSFPSPVGAGHFVDSRAGRILPLVSWEHLAFEGECGWGRRGGQGIVIKGVGQRGRNPTSPALKSCPHPHPAKPPVWDPQCLGQHLIESSPLPRVLYLSTAAGQGSIWGGVSAPLTPSVLAPSTKGECK